MPNSLKKKKQDVDTKNIIESLTKISEAITSDLYLDDILKLIVTVIADTLGSKICSLMLLDIEKNELSVKATQSMSKNYLKKPNIKFGEGIAGKVAKSCEPISVYNLSKDERYINRDIAEEENLKSLLSIPMILKGKIIGVLNCYTEKFHKFSQDEINLVKTVANQAAIIIENFKLVLESKVIREELETRKMIERAKGILMRQHKILEEEAYNKLRKYSMDRRKSMREVSEALIIAEDIIKEK